VHKAKKTIHGGFKEKMAKEAKAKHSIKHKLVKRHLLKHKKHKLVEKIRMPKKQKRVFRL